MFAHALIKFITGAFLLTILHLTGFKMHSTTNRSTKIAVALTQYMVTEFDV